MLTFANSLLVKPVANIVNLVSPIIQQNSKMYIFLTQANSQMSRSKLKVIDSSISRTGVERAKPYTRNRKIISDENVQANFKTQSQNIVSEIKKACNREASGVDQLPTPDNVII